MPGCSPGREQGAIPGTGRYVVSHEVLWRRVLRAGTVLNCCLAGPRVPAPSAAALRSSGISGRASSLDGTPRSQEMAYGMSSLSPERVDQARHGAGARPLGDRGQGPLGVGRDHGEGRSRICTEMSRQDIVNLRQSPTSNFAPSGGPHSLRTDCGPAQPQLSGAEGNLRTPPPGDQRLDEVCSVTRSVHPPTLTGP